MGPKFAKLRFNEFAKAAAAGVIAGAVALQPAPAAAATGAIHVMAGTADWFVNTNITFSTTSSGGLAVSAGSIGSSSRTGAYDGALTWHVYQGALSNPAGDYTDPGGATSLPNPPHNRSVGSTVTGSVQVIDGLNVQAQLYFSPVKAVMRSVLFLTNPSGAPITVNVENATDQGAGSNTFVQATSSSDNPFNYANDHWVVISNGASPPNSGVPVTTYALGEAAAAAQATGINGPTNGTRDFYFTYNGITVPAGATRAVMVFTQMSGTVASAETDAPLFNSGSTLQGTDYLAGLSPAQKAEIVNWNISSLAVPTLSQWNLAGLAGLLGLAGAISAGFLRRRRHSMKPL